MGHFISFIEQIIDPNKTIMILNKIIKEKTKKKINEKETCNVEIKVLRCYCDFFSLCLI
jgi:hypothetical protein